MEKNVTEEQEGAIPFSVDISRMIELLASQIYPSPFALLRENVQNAFDAIMLRRHKGQTFEPVINLVIEASRIEVSDNGIGMSRQELRDHFWRAGSSSKNTDAARAAGVVGTFGIGAMANFGIADRLEVVSESANIAERTRCIAERATLSVTDDCIKFSKEEATGNPGSVVTAVMQSGKSIDVTQAKAYINDFVRFIDIAVYVNGELVSQTPLDRSVPDLVASWSWKGASVALGSQISADVSLAGSGSGDIRLDISQVFYNGRAIDGRMILRQGMGAIKTFRNRFGLAAASIPSSYGLGGVADFLLLQPTAGREALTSESLTFLNLFANPLDAIISRHLSEHPEANNSQYFINWVAAHQKWDLAGQLRARIEPGDSEVLKRLAEQSQARPLLAYGGGDPGILRLASVDRPVLQLARNAQRRQCEEGYLNAYGKLEQLTDEPKVLKRLDKSELDIAQTALAFRLTEILNSDYFLSVDLGFGSISHGLPILVTGVNPTTILLDPAATNVAVILQIYEKEYGAFGHMAKDFVRNAIFPRVSHLVPSATRQGTDAFLKTLQRTRDVFEYERADLENLTSLWTDYLQGKIGMEEATVLSAAVQRSYQVLESSSTGRVRDVVPDVSEGQQFSPSVAGDQHAALPLPANTNLGPMPPIFRTDMETDRKLLTIEASDPSLKGFRCFLALSNRVREERGEFFFQPHRTSIVWGGQKALFIFEHHSGEVGLYYDVQMKEPVAEGSGGGSYETCTIIMKNQVFIPVPEDLQSVFMPQTGEIKRLEVRCDLLFIDRRV